MFQVSGFMRVIDIIFALVSGRIIGFLLGDFLREWGINIGFYWNLVIWVITPIVSLICLWIAYLIGKKLLFVFQGAKYLLVGAVVTVIDLKVFELLVWFFSIFILISPLISKSISFVVSTFLKYWGNKYWAFQKFRWENHRESSIESGHESFNAAQDKKEDIKKEVIRFFLITLMGLIIDVLSFYYLVEKMEPQFGFPGTIWIKLSVIFAALAAALWNFLGYKFLVFKK